MLKLKLYSIICRKYKFVQRESIRSNWMKQRKRTTSATSIANINVH
uniref:Uncharacterized protein n=1 Tax=Romanomermis culicivorax TaxID=13658 RepID=A0A915J4T8_ROMCU